MVLISILRWVTGRPSWIVEIYKQWAQNKRAEKWHAHTEHLVSHLRDGTDYEETTRDGSVKIRTPPAQATRISVILDHQEPEIDPCQTSEIQSHQPKELAGEDSPPASDPSTHG